MTYPGRNILSEAAEAVDGPRRDKYGHPVDNHGCTAGFYTEYLRRRGLLAPDAELTARDVCMLNALQKISRDAHVPDHDNLVDIAGWARNAEIVSEGNDKGRPEDRPLTVRRWWRQRRVTVPAAPNPVTVRSDYC